MTSAMPVQCATNWAMKPTGSWSYCKSVTREGWINECKYMKHIFWTADESSNRRKILAVSTQLKQLQRSCDLLFDLSYARAPRQTSSRRLQALVGEHAQRQTHLHRNCTTVLTLSMRPSTRCCQSLSSGWAEMTRKYPVLWEISGCHSETPDKGASPLLLNFTNLTARFWKPSRKLREFSSCARIRLHDCFRNQLETMHENDPFDVFPGFSDMVYMSLQCYLLHPVLQKDHSVRWTYWKLTSAAPWGNNVSVLIALINIERVYTNSVVNNDMDLIIDIFSRRNGRDNYFF